MTTSKVRLKTACMPFCVCVYASAALRSFLYNVSKSITLSDSVKIRLKITSVLTTLSFKLTTFLEIFDAAFERLYDRCTGSPTDTVQCPLNTFAMFQITRISALCTRRSPSYCSAFILCVISVSNFDTTRFDVKAIYDRTVTVAVDLVLVRLHTVVDEHLVPHFGVRIVADLLE